jgi:two-component system chemotaxis response regulator CheY
MPQAAAPLTTLKMSARDQQKLIDYVEQSGRRTIDEERRSLRVDFTGRKALISIETGQGQKVEHAVLPRNLSRWGLAFVHGRFVYPNANCRVTMPMANGKWYVIDGVIRFCRHVSGIIHEVSVVFVEPVDLNDFVTLNDKQLEAHRNEQDRECQSDESGISDSHGSALVFDENEIDRKLNRLWLERIGLRVTEAVSPAELLSKMGDADYALVLVSVENDPQRLNDTLTDLRTHGYERAVLVSSTSESEDEKQAALKSGASGYLAKPFEMEQLRDEVERLLAIDSSSSGDLEPLHSSLKDDEGMETLINQFVRGLQPMVNRLRRANAECDLDTLAEVCRSLKGSGLGFGYSPITEAAQAALGLLSESADDLDAVQGAVNDLVLTLRRAMLGRHG